MSGTHHVFDADEIPWKARGETKADHLDILALVKMAGIDLVATFEAATGEDFEPSNVSVTPKSLRFRRGQVIATHTHLGDLHRSGIVAMLKRITTFQGCLFYTDGTDHEDNGYQELSFGQWAVLDTRETYYGEILDGEETPRYVEMDLWSLSFRNAGGDTVAIAPDTVITCEPASF